MGHPTRPVSYFTPAGIPLSCCKLGLLKCTIPVMDHMPSKEVKKVKVLVWNILPLFTPDSAASPPPAVAQPTRMIWTTRSSSQNAATLTSKDQATSAILAEGKTSPYKFLLDHLFLNYFFIFWLCWVFVAAQAFSSCGKQGLLSLAAVHGLLIAMACLVAEHRL